MHTSVALSPRGEFFFNLSQEVIISKKKKEPCVPVLVLPYLNLGYGQHTVVVGGKIALNL